jgi:hypothetical protein
MKKIILLLAVAGFAVGLPAARADGFGDLGPYFSFEYGDGGGIPADVNNTTGQQTSPDGLSVKLYGDLGPIDGARFGNGFVLYWQGGFQGTINPGDSLVADLTFSAHATGGTLAWNFYTSLWSNEGFEQAQIMTDPAPMPPSGDVTGALLDSSAFTQPGQTGIFQGYLHLDWSGFSPTDTLTVSIPQNSIDITLTPAPEPGVLPLTLTALLLIHFWRWSRSKFVGSPNKNFIRARIRAIG